MEIFRSGQMEHRVGRQRQPRPGLKSAGGWSALIAALALLASAAQAAPCTEPSYRTTRLVFGCEYARLLRAQRKGTEPDFGRCEDQMRGRMSRVGARYDACLPAAELQATIDACVASARAVVDPGTNPVCRIRYYSRARGFTRCGITAMLRTGRLDGTADLMRCRTSLGRSLDRVRARLDGCPVVSNADFETALLSCLLDLESTVNEGPSWTATPTPSETPVPEDTATVTPTTTQEPTGTATEVPTDTATPEPTATATDTVEPDSTATPTEVPTDTATPEPTATATDTVEPDSTATPTEVPTDTATPEPTATATDTVEPDPTATPTEVPTDTETPDPTATPTDTATQEPTSTPTSTPTEIPTVPVDFRRVFISSTTTNGSFPDGVEGADGFCQDLADTAGLPGRFVAWLSTGDAITQARDRLENANVPYYLVDGTQVADNFEDLVDGSLDAAINLDEYGTVRNVTNGVWTGTAANGTGVSGFNDNVRCRKWTSSASGDGGRLGTSSATNNNWTNTGNNSACNNEHHVYCFQSNHRTVFVTSTTHDGNLGTVRGADAICQARADGAGLEGNFVAWLSTGDSLTRARDRIENAPAPYRLVDGTRVALQWSDLVDGTLENPINLDESGNLVEVANGVWTGTAGDGTGVSGGNNAVRCGQWTSNSSGNSGRVGTSTATASQWTNSGSNVTCDQPRRLYCVESQLKCGAGSKCVFRSSGSTSANMGGLAGADAFCQAAADASSNVAAGTYKAWLSTPSEPVNTRITPAAVPYVMPNGRRITNSGSDLLSTTLVDACMDQHEHDINGSSPLGCAAGIAWSATNNSGGFRTAAGFGSCGDWTSTASGTTWPTHATNLRQGSDTVPCNQAGMKLYCVQQ